MPEQLSKSALSATSPVARTGGGDISEREFSRERHTLQSTPPTRVQRTHPKRQLFSAPVNKFTGRAPGASSNLARIRTCLDEFRPRAILCTPGKPRKVVSKAVSMEDLTPAKLNKNDEQLRKNNLTPLYVSRLRFTGVHTEEQMQAAARISRFMLLAAWRRRRDEVVCMKKTLSNQVSCSERLRVQVCSLKTLVDSDNVKVRLAIKELERLKQRLNDKEMERLVLQREKTALENDIIAAEDRASELSIGWRNTLNELGSVKSALSMTEQALSLEKTAAIDANFHKNQALERLSELEEELHQKTAQLASATTELMALKSDKDDKRKLIDKLRKKLKAEHEARESTYRECLSLSAQLHRTREENTNLHLRVAGLRTDLARTCIELAGVREQLAWWPKPLTEMMGSCRSLIRRSLPLSEAVMWSLIPARHGC